MLPSPARYWRKERVRGAGQSAETPIWPILSGVGLALVLSGGVELALGLYPLRVGIPDWELGTAADFVDRLPLLGLGLLFLLGSALAQGKTALTLFWSVACILVSMVIVTFGLLVATSLPLVLAVPLQGNAQIALVRGLSKFALGAVLYPVALVGAASYSLVVLRRASNR